jgi:hypothetical protein
MAYITEKVTIFSGVYTLVTNKVALVQFTEPATVIIGGVEQPASDAEGFRFTATDKYVNGTTNAYVWAKSASYSESSSALVAYDAGV